MLLKHKTKDTNMHKRLWIRSVTKSLCFSISTKVADVDSERRGGGGGRYQQVRKARDSEAKDGRLVIAIGAKPVHRADLSSNKAGCLTITKYNPRWDA